MSGPSAVWPMPALLTSLAHADTPALAGRAGHGPLAMLTALAACLPHGSASGTVTAAQVADKAGYSERRGRDALHVLERLGLVEWERGYRGHAGRMTIVKVRVVAMIRAGRRAVSRAVGRAVRWVEARHRHRLVSPTEIPDMTSAPTPFREVTGPEGSAGSRPPARHPRHHRTGDLMIQCIHHRDQRTCTKCGPKRAHVDDPRPCSVCWRPEAQCRTANSKVPAALQHAYVAHVAATELV